MISGSELRRTYSDVEQCEIDNLEYLEENMEMTV